MEKDYCFTACPHVWYGSLVHGEPNSILCSAQQVTSLLPQGQELIFLHSTCCSGFLCPCIRGWRGEVSEYITHPYFHEQTNTPYARTRTWQSPLITLLCSLWVSTDKQCDDQRPLIALQGEGVGGQGLIRLWKGLKETRAQYLRNGNKKKENMPKQRPVLSSLWP